MYYSQGGELKKHPLGGTNYELIRTIGGPTTGGVDAGTKNISHRSATILMIIAIINMFLALTVIFYILPRIHTPY